MHKGITLEGVQEWYTSLKSNIAQRVIVCGGTGCVAGGSLEVYEEFTRQIEQAGLPVILELSNCDRDNVPDNAIHVSHSGCQGFCQQGPLVTIEPSGIMYTHVQASDVTEIVEETLLHGEVIDRLLYVDPATGTHCPTAEEIPFYKRQHRTVLKECGLIDPADIDEYISHGGYRAARRAFRRMEPRMVCEEVESAGLRGRGGGGFPTGKKWRFALQEVATTKYVICNGDEGDPGAFMDRSLMEGNPHGVLEGMMIAARAIGATEGYVYVRMEYPLAVQRMLQAVKDAEAYGFLGDNIFNSAQSFRIHVKEGAGAFVCGEETALMASIEGKRGMPNPKPPFPAQKGLWGCPTIINNVETLASVPMIINHGAEAFRSMGTDTSPGTKTYALTGHVANTGLIEVPFGTTLREIVYNIGGGVTDDNGEITDAGFKAVQIGGPSGGCLTQEHLNLPLDYDSLKSVNAMVGSGGLVVMNQGTCMVKIARFFMEFTQNESCGKCVLCREGTKQMLHLLDTIIAGEGTLETLDLLEELALAVQKGSLCGLGKTAPNPVLSTMRQFRDEYEAHVVDKRCPAQKCKALCVPTIIPSLCRGCGLCLRKCPVDAISGEKRQPHVIDPDVCIKCGTCAEVCKFHAIEGV